MAARTSGFEHAMQRLQFEHERELALLRAEISELKHRQIMTGSNEEEPISPRNNLHLPFWASPTKQDEAAQGLSSIDAEKAIRFSLLSNESGNASPTLIPHMEDEKVVQSIDAERKEVRMEDEKVVQSIDAERKEESKKRKEESTVGRSTKKQLHRSLSQKLEHMDEHISLLPMWRSSASPNIGERRLHTVLMSKRFSDDLSGGGFDMMKKLLKNRSSALSGPSASRTAAMIATCVASLIIRPGSRQKLVWDACTMTALSFDLFWIPMQVFNPEETTIISIVIWSCLIIWTLDIFLATITGYSKSDGVEVTDFRKILLRYLKTWFVADLLIVGLDWFLMLEDIRAEGDQSRKNSAARVVKVMRLLRMLRTLRFLRLLKLREFFYAAQQKLDTEWAAIVYGMIFNVVIIIVLNHTFACVWWLLGKSQPDGWVAAVNALARGIQWQYFTCLHWTLTQFTPASMEIQPNTGDERVFAVFMLIFGLLVFSSFLSSVTAGVTRLRNMQESKARERYALRRYLRENNISSSLGVRINRYIDIVQQVRHQRIHATEVKLLNLLSGPLRVELQTELHSPTLTAHEVFWLYNKKSHAAMSELCFEAVGISHLSKHDCLFAVFKEARHMYVSTSGAMVYIRIEDIESEAPLRCYIQHGLIISEPTLWVAWIHRGSMLALTETSAMNVNSEAFGRVTRQQPDAYVAMISYAQKYVEIMKRTAEEHGLVFDLDFDSMLENEHLADVESEVIRAELLEAEIIDDTYQGTTTIDSSRPSVII